MTTDDLTHLLTVPIDHMGEPATATVRLPTVRLASGEWTADTVHELARVLAESKAPFNIQIVQALTPLFVTEEQAAELLSVHVGHIEDLMDNGWLRYTHTRTHRDTRQTRVTSSAVAEATGDYTGWRRLVEYASLVEVAQRAMELGRLPHLDEIAPTPTRWKGRNGTKGQEKLPVSQTALNVLADLAKKGGPEAWVSLSELTDLVLPRLGPTYRRELTAEARWKACFKTVQNSMTTGRSAAHRRGIVERRVKPGYDEFGMHFVPYQYHWVGASGIVENPTATYKLAKWQGQHKLQLTNKDRRWSRAQCSCGKWDELVRFDVGGKAERFKELRRRHVEHVRAADLKEQAKIQAANEPSGETHAR